MNIKALHREIEDAHFKLVSGRRGLVNDQYCLSRPVYIESIIKHPALPAHFDKAFNEIMGEGYEHE